MLMTARRQRDARPAGSRGFTLLELVVTIALLGLLVMLSVPSFVTWIRNSQVRTVTEALQTGLRTAQAESVRGNRQVVLFFTNDEPALNVSTSQAYTDAAPVANGRRWVVQTVPGPWGGATYLTGGKLSDVASGASIANDQGAAAICFNSNGRMATTAAGSTGTGVSAACTAAITVFSITSTNADRPLNIWLQLGGQLRMCDPKRPTQSSTSPDGCPAPAAP